MTGTWSGYYQYNNSNHQKILGFEKTFFTITIQSCKENQFKGIVIDDIKSGGMEGTGEILGAIKDGTIQFKKFMPRHSIRYPNGDLKYTEGRHPTIYYSGIISKDQKQASGVWKFKIKIGFLFGIIPIPYRPGKGTWSMSLQ